VGRVASLDTGRVVAVLAVLNLHARLFRVDELHGWQHVVEIVADHASRFAVPFFFFVSGYLLGRSTRGGPALPRAAASFKRVVILYLAWSVLLLAVEPLERGVYNLLAADRLSDPPLVWPAPREFVQRLFEGARMQLWFLPALGTALLVVGLLDRARPAVGLVVAIALYAVGLAGGVYSPVTGFELGQFGRNGPFFATLFVFLGCRMGKADARPWLGPAIALVVAGAALQGLEIWCLHEYYQAAWLDPRSNYFIGTSLMGIGAGRIALARPDLGAGTVWPRLGALTLGIYLLHVDVQQYWLAPILVPRGLAGQFGLVFISYAVSAALTWAMARTRVGRRLVT
jgi:surface polysaccharide O-acyltransferase-like enzyme